MGAGVPLVPEGHGFGRAKCIPGCESRDGAFLDGGRVGYGTVDLGGFSSHDERAVIKISLSSVSKRGGYER